MGYGLKKEILKVGIFYLILICVIYSPIILYGKTLSFAVRYPWFTASPPEEISVLPETYPNIFNVDIAAPSALEEPIDKFVGNQIKRGKFPMWNPFISCGTIIQEEFATRTLFPYQLLQNVCPWKWRDFFLLGRLWFAAMGVFIFLKLLGLSFYPSLCGGVMYGFSGAMTIFLTFNEMSNVGMVLPYVLLGGELLNRKQSILSIILCSLTTALLILGGQPEIAFYGILFLFFYYFFRIITTKEKEISIIKKIAFFFFSMMLALLISSPFFVPFLVNSKHFYTLHPPGGTQGVETPTPLANFMAIFLPELLRWRSVIFAFTLNAGWDSLGGYVGIAGIFLIIVSFKRHWWGRKEYLFFLCFALFVLLKNMGMPIVSLIGRLPIFDQVWTPRWTGPIWNLSLALSAALGFQALILTGDKASNENGSKNLLKSNLWGSWILMIGGILILSLGLLINSALWAILTEFFKEWIRFPLSMVTILRVFFIIISGLMLFRSSRSLNLSSVFLILSFGIALCVFNFQAQLPHIEGPFKNVLEISDKLVLISMWQGMMESTVLGLVVLLALSIALRQRHIDRINFALILSGIVIIEMAFHVTIGYDESSRLVKFLLHLAALLSLILYLLFSKKIANAKVKIGVCLLLVGMIGVGAVGKNCIPNRKEVFEYPFENLNYDGFSRVMGIKGLIFPNLSAALGMQDIKSIASVSIRRFQLFQDYCLFIKPQGKYKSLWFTGIMDPKTGKDISGHIRERYSFYALAGVTNYLSPHYEDIPYTKLIQDDTVKNYQNLAVMPRAFMVHKWSVARTVEESLDWMLTHYSSFDSEAIVEGLDTPLVPRLQEKPFTEAKIRSYDLHSVIIDVGTNTSGLLVLTDSYHPDWIATVDGKRQKVFPTNLCFRGVFLNPGKHEIKFIYFPKTFYVCTTVSLITLLILLVLVLKSLRAFIWTKYLPSKN